MAVQPTYTKEPVGLLDMTYGLTPGTGSPTAITPITGGVLSGYSSSAYPGGAAIMQGMALPKGQTYDIAQFGGDNLDLGTFIIGENNPIRITDQYGNVIFSGTGYAGAQQAADITKQLVDIKDLKQFSVEGYDPYTGTWQGLAGSTRPTDGWGELADVVLPVVGGVLGGPLGAALGAAASGTAQGKSIKEIGISSALAGAGSYLGGKIPGINFGSSVPASAASSAAGSTAGSALGAGGEILVSRFLPSAVGSAFGSTGSAALANAIANSPNAQALNRVDPNQITVTGQVSPPVNLGSGAGAIVPGVLSPEPIVSPSGDEMLLRQQVQQPTRPDTTLPVPDFSGVEPIAKPLTPEQIANATTPTTNAPGVGAPTTGGGSSTPTTKPSLLDDVLKYYGIAAPVIGGLLDLVGAGGGGAATGTAMPYVSQLGAMPNLGRGAFTPYTGDYEKYAFGPEWNFFGGQPVTPAAAPAATPASVSAVPVSSGSQVATSAPNAAPAPVSFTPELSTGLLNRATQVEDINRRYASQYGLSDADLYDMYLGLYNVNMNDPANSPLFGGNKSVMDAYRTELENLYGGQRAMRSVLTSPIDPTGQTNFLLTNAPSSLQQYALNQLGQVSTAA